ncbi:MAG TPA: hypothetical protein VMV83_16175 [Rectinemataceae bacterium]|nr:hypothetical protein [Rectinemataceae bacterium]
MVYGVIQDVTEQVRATEAAAKEVLDGLESRVRSVELLCDGLFGAETERRVRARDYVPRLTGGALADRPHLDSACVDAEIDDFSLEPGRMLLLGLALTEMLNIAMGREVRNVPAGSIRVEVTCAEGRVSLLVESEMAAKAALSESSAFLTALLPRLSASFRREAGLRRLVFAFAI